MQYLSRRCALEWGIYNEAKKVQGTHTQILHIGIETETTTRITITDYICMRARPPSKCLLLTLLTGFDCWATQHPKRHIGKQIVFHHGQMVE